MFGVSMGKRPKKAPTREEGGLEIRAEPQGTKSLGPTALGRWLNVSQMLDASFLCSV